MADDRGTIVPKLKFLPKATQAARANHFSPANQVERWARLGRALEAHPNFSSANVEAAVTGTKTVEELSSLERIAFFERVPEIFRTPSADIVAAYTFLSNDPNTGISPKPSELEAD